MSKQNKPGFQTSRNERIACCLFPAVGFAVAMVILLPFYKLKTRDLQIMAQYNNGQLSKEDADAFLTDKFGPVGER